MGLAAIIRSGVAVAMSATSNLQSSLTQRAWTGAVNAKGTVTTTDRTITALLQRKQKLIKRASGQEVMAEYSLTILEELAPIGSAGRTEPVDQRDVFVLPDGYIARVVLIDGLINPDTSNPYLLQVWLS